MNGALSIALLNQSEYLPNQILHGTLGLLIFLVLFVLSRKWKTLWAKYLRIAAYFHLLLFAGVAVFKLSSWPPLVTAVLGAFPALERFHPFEPAAHMIEEVATMGGYSYLAVVYLRREYPNVIERPWLYKTLGTAFPVYAVCWVLALVIGLADPFPMTGLYTELNTWSVPYRALILVPGILYCSLFTYVFIQAAFQHTVVRSAIRLVLLSIGTLAWTLVCAEQLGWAAVHAFASEDLRNLLAWPHVTAESILYATWATSWLIAFLIAYQTTHAERTMQDYMQYLRLMRYLKSITHNARRSIPHWAALSRRLEDATAHFNLSQDDHRAAGKLVEIVAYSQLASGHYSTLLAQLCRLRSSLLESLPADSTEVRAVLTDPEGRCLDPAGALISSPEPPNLENAEDWIQIAVYVLHKYGSFRSPHHPKLDPGISSVLARSP